MVAEQRWLRHQRDIEGKQAASASQAPGSAAQLLLANLGNPSQGDPSQGEGLYDLDVLSPERTADEGIPRSHSAKVLTIGACLQLFGRCFCSQDQPQVFCAAMPLLKLLHDTLGAKAATWTLVEWLAFGCRTMARKSLQTAKALQISAVDALKSSMGGTAASLEESFSNRTVCTAQPCLWEAGDSVLADMVGALADVVHVLHPSDQKSASTSKFAHWASALKWPTEDEASQAALGLPALAADPKDRKVARLRRCPLLGFLGWCASNAGFLAKMLQERDMDNQRRLLVAHGYRLALRGGIADGVLAASKSRNATITAAAAVRNTGRRGRKASNTSPKHIDDAYDCLTER